MKRPLLTALLLAAGLAAILPTRSNRTDEFSSAMRQTLSKIAADLPMRQLPEAGKNR
jgi:hypothetical protein